LRKTQPNARRTFRSPLPVWVHWALIVIMPAFGILALFALPGKTLQVLLTTAGLMVISVLAVQFSIWYSKNEAAMRLQAKAS
jgi:hypothetical protein